ncbi:hypothetical protein BJY24_006982 [Nocardia transvalensis]|uniref:Uncharacterized protein n=1 Tax=Nocardia transvalensis TaxID=37333 RepID=A0A7W9PLF6_9NOCA|nr:hypothetical protein [Nocardia transvalensis]
MTGLLEELRRIGWCEHAALGVAVATLFVRNHQETMSGA